MNKVLSAIGGFFKTIWNFNGRVWLLVTVIVLTVVFTATMIATQVFSLRESISMLFSDAGTREWLSGNPEDFRYFEVDEGLDSKAKVLAAADKFNTSIAAEGFTLLKNDNALPLDVETEKEISILGKNSVSLIYGGEGSGGKDASNAPTVYSTLQAAGFNTNPALKTFYESSASGAGRGDNPSMGSFVWGHPTGETAISNYGSNGLGGHDIAAYSKAAIIVIARMGGEGYDLPRTSYANSSMRSNALTPGRVSGDEHYLQLDKNEKDLIAAANASFEKVIVLVNSSVPIELGDLNADSGTLSVDAILWIGLPGGTGINALGGIISGTTNPSGRTVDTYARDFKLDPTWHNFGDNSQTSGKPRSHEYLDPVEVDDFERPAPYYNKQDSSYKYIEYEEGIYIGYRYYETRGYVELQNDPTSTWYEDNVVYPLGHGLSYTDFSWQIVDAKTTATATPLAKDAEITVTVNVTNEGTRPGKDVVQLYVNAPYDSVSSTAIEKSHVVLAGFGKTPVLYPAAQVEDGKPGSAEVDITFKLRDVASYDFDDANVNDFFGYEIEAGAYNVFVSQNAHDAVHMLTYTVSGDGYTYETMESGAAINSGLFQEESDYMLNKPGTYASRSGENARLMSRQNFAGTFPVAPSEEERKAPYTFYDALDVPSAANFNSDGKGSLMNVTWADINNPWYSDTTPTQAKSSNAPFSSSVQLYEMRGKPYNHEDWNVIMDHITIDEMVRVITTGNFQTQEIMSIGKPRTVDPDGPVGFTNFIAGENGVVYDTAFYVSECITAATWNVDIAYEMGRMIGNEGIIGNERGDGDPYSGWYGPALNIHRSPFSGRNWEYYSEDGFLSGVMAANVVAGANSKGLYTYLKHFALNDQETHRDGSGLVTWADEQTMREIYFKAFEIAVVGVPYRTEGGSRAIMSSFNRIGRIWAGGDYRLLTQLLREEWGFNGVVVTDYIVGANPYSPDQMIRAGGNLVLNQGFLPLRAANDSTQITLMREATKGILYTVANSMAMNGAGEGVTWAYSSPVWVIWLILINIGLLLCFAIWGFFVIRNAYKKRNNKST